VILTLPGSIRRLSYGACLFVRHSPMPQEAY